MWIKICGTTNVEDALLAVEAGADAIGLVFAESPRRVEPIAARHIVAQLPPGVEKVGVFVKESAQQILDVSETVGLTAVQFYGSQGSELMARRPRGPKVVAVVGPEQLESLLAPRVDVWPFDLLMVDSAGGRARGGTGQAFDWRAAEPAIRHLREGGVSVIIAGGLAPDNVAEAVHTLRPWGVDVVSGVEREPGRKDAEKVRAFIRAARAAADRI